MVEQAAVLDGTQLVQVFTDAILADEQTAAGDLERGVGREQVGCLVPLRLVDVLAVDGLEVQDVDVVVGALRLGAKLRHFGLQLLQLPRLVGPGAA
jgi:hypothetical protein